jgi:hypothetical protein
MEYAWLCRGQMLLGKLDDGDMVPQLFSRALPMTEHKSKRSFDHRFIRNLKGGFGIDHQILSRCYYPFLRIGEKLPYLLRVHRL